MVSEQGVVEQVVAGKAQIRIERSGACATCGSRDLCDLGDDKAMRVQVTDTLQVQEGDRVELTVGVGRFLGLSALIYLLPVAALVAGAMLAGSWAGSLGMARTPTSMIGGFGAMAAVFFALRSLDKRTRKEGRFQPQMTRIITRSSATRSTQHP